MGRGARGVIGMKLEDGSKVISMLVAGDESQYVLTACENGYGKCTPIAEYTRHGRATQGMIAIATSERNGKVVAAVLVRREDSVMLLTGRSTQGVTLIDIKNDKLVRLSRVAEDDAESEQQGSQETLEGADMGPKE